MATIELQTSTELAESRRKMQAKRRLKNRIALTLSMGPWLRVCSGLSGS
jgi:phosphate transport system permease protein